MMMFFWIAFIGRGYCYFCPLGTVLSLFAKIAGQKIKTDNTKCVNYNKCNKVYRSSRKDTISTGKKKFNKVML